MQNLDSGNICTIAIPIWNNLEATCQCLTSLVKCTEYPHEILLIDNGSQEPTKKYLEGFCKGRSNCRIKRFDENIGYLSAVNYALTAIKTRYICLLNNDTILTDGWLSECIFILNSSPDIGIACPTTNDTSHRFKKLFTSGGINAFKGKGIEVTSCMGCCFILKKQVVDLIGPFDPDYGEGYLEEVDYCLKASSAGFRSVMALGAYITHIGKMSFGMMPEKIQYLWKKNNALLTSRWGMPERILIFVKNRYSDDELEKARNVILKKCRKRAIVDIYCKSGLEWIRDVHFSIREKNSPLYNLLILKFIVKLKRKGYDTVVTDAGKGDGFIKFSDFIPPRLRPSDAS